MTDSPHHNCGTSITESDFQFPPDKSLCPAIANTVSQLSSHHQHFEICGCQDDTLEQGVTWCQKGLYAGYFKISHQKCYRDLSSHISIVWLSNVMQKLSTFHKQEKAALLKALQCSSFEQHAPTLIVVPCCMKPTNIHLWCWNMMAITASRLHNLECHWPTMIPLLAYMFRSSVR
jgi:hypothetical protein